MSSIYIVSVLCNTGCPGLSVTLSVGLTHCSLPALRYVWQHRTPVDTAKTNQLLGMCLQPEHSCQLHGIWKLCYTYTRAVCTCDQKMCSLQSWQPQGPTFQDISRAYLADVQLFCNVLRQMAVFSHKDVLHKCCKLHGGLCRRDGHRIPADNRPLYN